jgi:hypothetical protein
LFKFYGKEIIAVCSFLYGKNDDVFDLLVQIDENDLLGRLLPLYQKLKFNEDFIRYGRNT